MVGRYVRVHLVLVSEDSVGAGWFGSRRMPKSGRESGDVGGPLWPRT